MWKCVSYFVHAVCYYLVYVALSNFFPPIVEGRDGLTYSAYAYRTLACLNFAAATESGLTVLASIEIPQMFY
jgi:hypothetical protein